MIFGFFKKKNKTSFHCPMCEKNYAIDIDINDLANEEPDYLYRRGGIIISDEQSCDFCKTTMTLVYYSSGRIHAYDDKWEIKQKAHNDKVKTITIQIDEIYDANDGENITQVEQKKIDAFESKIEKLEDAFSTVEERYDERKSNWIEKHYS